MNLISSNVEKIPQLGAYVKSHVREVLEGMSGMMSESMIAPIHPDVNIYYNSVNVIVGKQSLGKTVIAIEEIIKISVLGTHHMLVYVTKTGDENDKSFKALKNSILMPIVTISEKQVQEFIEMLIAFKNLYYEIKEDHLEDKIMDEQKEQMFKFLCIDDFSKNFVKNEITTLFIFPCYNKQQLRYIYSQSGSNLDFDEFYKMYSEMTHRVNQVPNTHPYMVVQVRDGGVTSVIY